MKIEWIHFMLLPDDFTYERETSIMISLSFSGHLVNHSTGHFRKYSYPQRRRLKIGVT